MHRELEERLLDERHIGPPFDDRLRLIRALLRLVQEASGSASASSATFVGRMLRRRFRVTFSVIVYSHGCRRSSARCASSILLSARYARTKASWTISSASSRLPVIRSAKPESRRWYSSTIDSKFSGPGTAVVRAGAGGGAG